MIVVAPDKFKGTYSAGDICHKISEAVGICCKNEEILEFPMADGGEGTSAVIARRLHLPQKTVRLLSPVGTPMTVTYYSDGVTAAVDSSAVLGMEAVNAVADDPDAKDDAMGRSSYPLGEIIGRLIDEGVKTIYVGVGGTMTVDGGIGALQALGWKFLDRNGNQPDRPLTAHGLIDIAQIIPAHKPEDCGCHIVAIVDVDVPLICDGDADRLSSLSFARQKGIKECELGDLRNGLVNLLDKLKACGIHVSESFAGAGGGTGLFLQLIGGKMLPGAEAIWQGYTETTAFDYRKISHIYTGEGCFDLQSLTGKVTGMLIEYGCRHDIPVTVVCGICRMPDDVLADLCDKGVEVVTLREFL